MSRRPSDHDVEQFIARLLQVGVFAAAAVGIIGGGLLLMQHGGMRADFSVFRGEPPHLTSVPGILRGVREMRSESIVQLGIVLLIATPLMRVASTLVAFILQRDRTYVVVTSIVLTLLLYGLIWGKA
jgi:uncharacterized membrane protein